MKLSLQSEEDGIVRLHSEGEIRLGDQLREHSSVEDIIGARLLQGGRSCST